MCQYSHLINYYWTTVHVILLLGLLVKNKTEKSPERKNHIRDMFNLYVLMVFCIFF